MVRLNTSLLAVTLATGSALAFSNEYQRRNGFNKDYLKSRGFVNEEDIFVRDLDAFDDLEARNIGVRVLGEAGKFVKHNKHAKHVFRGVKIANDFLQSRGLEEDNSLFVRDLAEELFGREYDLLDERDNEDLFVRDLDAFDDLEARNIGVRVLGEAGKFVKHNKHAKNVFRGVKIANDFLQSRDLEEDKSRFVRDLDAEELFGREYDFLDERDNEDLFVRDLDAFDDLEARNIGVRVLGEAGKFVKHNKHAKHVFRGVKIANDFLQSRGLEEDNSVFVRDLDAGELFGREYDSLDEREYYPLDERDDLD